MAVTIDRTLRRRRRIRGGIVGTAEKPRLTVFRSNRHIYVQAVDDAARKTLVSYSSLQGKGAGKGTTKKTETAKMVGKALAVLLVKHNIKTCVFDRNVYAYKGRVKALAEGVREGGVTV